MKRFEERFGDITKGKKKINVGSVRARILNFLRSEGPMRFTDIKKELGHHEYVIKRELDILKKYGWVKQEGHHKGTRYILDRTTVDKSNELDDVFRRLDATLDPNSKLYPVNVDLNHISSEVFEHRTNHTVEFTLPHLEIIIAGEKIDGFKTTYLGRNSKALAAIAEFMNDISLSRATQALLNKKEEIIKEGRNPNGRAEQIEAFGAYIEAHQQTFHLIIKRQPDRYGPLVSCPLPDSWHPDT